MRRKHIVDCIVVVVVMVVALVHTHVTLNHHERRSPQSCESFSSISFVANHSLKANFRQWVTSLMRCDQLVDCIAVVALVVVVDVHIPNRAEMTARLHPKATTHSIR